MGVHNGSCLVRPTTQTRATQSLLRHGRSWIRATAQATAPPMLVDTSDGYKYVTLKELQ